MGSYIPNTRVEREQMLARVGVPSLDALYDAVPRGMMLEALNLPDGLNELGAARAVGEMAAKNRVFPTLFRGAGAYRHYIPAIVRSVTSKEEFLTAYTPYQAEISQGILQSIFEYQTDMCELTGMDVSNASVYDGATAAAEAVAMCLDKKRPVALVADNIKPFSMATIETYLGGSEGELIKIATVDGALDLDALADALDGRTGCLYLESPNFYGLIEDVSAAADMVHAAGAKLILGVNPIALGLFETPRALGADIAVAEGQPLGLPLSFGGPYLGIMTATQAMARKLPGRIVGQTTDADGNRAFVLTLQAREQHIRREKASSNICSNQALCAMTAAVYLAAMGAQGLREVAVQCHAKAHDLAAKLALVPGFRRLHSGEFFHEFATACPVSPAVLNDQLAQRGILGGLPIEGGILWCATEMNTRAEIDALIAVLKEVAACN